MTRTTDEIQAARQGVLDAILAHPEMHDQNTFGEQIGCGTTMCIAGWACELDEQTATEWNEGSMWLHDKMPSPYGPTSSPYWAATEILGLTEDEADGLFHEYDNASALSRLKHLVDTGVLPPKDAA